jgi:hypothetical protein
VINHSLPLARTPGRSYLLPSQQTRTGAVAAILSLIWAFAGMAGLAADLAPRALGALLRRYPHFGGCEDEVQDAVIAATASGRRGAFPR